jgi:hypothetical protein
VADPVDSSTGSHVIQKSLLEFQGSLKFSFDLNYNSSQLSIGAMGKGWYNNYEMRIEKQPDGSLYYYSSPSSYIAYTQSSTAGLYTTSTIGNLGTIIYPNGKIVTYSYDAGNVTSGSDKVSYDQNNRLTAYNGINLAYDADGNMTTGVVGTTNSCRKLIQSYILVDNILIYND